MKKVLFVATVVKAHINTFHLPFLKWFKENGYETHVCARNDFENPADIEIPYCDKYYDLPFERSPINPNNYKTYKQLKYIINDNDYDIIHCHTPVGGALSRLAARNARKNGTKVIYTAHGFHFYNGAPVINWLVYYPIERFLSRYTDTLITINNEDYSRAKKNFNAKKVDYIPGVGIELEKYNKINIDVNFKKQELGIPVDAIILLSVGELNKNKNHEVIIKALSKISKPNVYYLICGQGELKGPLLELANSLHLTKQVKLLGYRKDIDEICAVSDIFVFPSFREGLSLSLMEAMALELPVVCSDIRGNRDLIEPSLGGYLLSPKDIEGFQIALTELIEQEKLRKKMAAFNNNKIQKFRIESVITKIEDVYGIIHNIK